ncbi:MAG: serine hydrolase domain-containing protein [Bacilli bacterium]
MKMKFYSKHLKSIVVIIATMFLILIIFSVVLLRKRDNYSAVRGNAARLADVLVSQYGVSGIQYALVCQGKMIVSGTAGVFNKENTQTLDNNSLFGIGSTSKMFATTAIMMLSDEGKVDLDQPVLTYIPEFKMADERYKQITVRMLLNHSSGIYGSTFQNAFLFDYPSPLAHDNLLSNLETQGLKAAPGEFSVYCNDGFTLAEIIVERISGMSFTDYIKQNITEPLKMTNTYTPQSDFDKERLVRTYVGNQETPVDTINVIGSGGIFSTAEDLCKFGQVYMSNPSIKVAKSMLSKNAKNKTKQKEYQNGFGPNQQDGLFGYGLGWDSVDAYPYSEYHIQPLIKGGDTQLYHSSLIVIPEHNIVFAAVLSGGSSFFGHVMGQKLILETLLSVGYINEIIAPVKIKVPELSSMPAEKVDYSGIYIGEDSVKKVTIISEGKMTISTLYRGHVPDEIYLYTSEGWFVNEDGSKKLTFVEESNGRIYIWVKWQLLIPDLGQASMSSYDYELIQSNEVDNDTQHAWDMRSGKKYYIVNDNPYAQQYYIPGSICFEITTSEQIPGYAAYYKIADKNKGVKDIQIPCLAGRDTSTLEIFEIGGAEYLRIKDMVYISEKAMTDLPTSENNEITVENDGYARWYTVNPKDIGKTLTVNIPEKSSFALYEDDICVYFSVIHGNHPVILPENGKVVFVGETPGVAFTVNVNEK